ncbi:hypothetical protein R3379_22240 [Bacillus sp. BAU-SS-2023]|nr:hypothetical protein [Bacillus sp. BAU-SS-2023]
MGFIFNKGIADSFNILDNSTDIVELNVESVILVILVGVLYIVSFVSIGSFLFVLIARVKNIYNDII